MAGTNRRIAVAALTAILLSGAAAPIQVASKPSDAGAKPAAMRDLCASGGRQSPLNIEKTDAANMLPLAFRYKLSLVTLSIANGALSGAYGSGSSVEIGKERFDLQGIAFRTPSEHRVLGRQFPAEIQFLHRSPKGRHAVVSVLVAHGRENLAVREIFERLPPRSGGTIADPKILMNARDLLPDERGYIRYSGSLTSAPCTEDVEWFLMSQPVRLSEAQIDRVRGAVGDNARDVQTRNGRYLLHSVAGN